MTTSVDRIEPATQHSMVKHYNGKALQKQWEIRQVVRCLTTLGWMAVYVVKSPGLNPGGGPVGMILPRVGSYISSFGATTSPAAWNTVMMRHYV